MSSSSKCGLAIFVGDDLREIRAFATEELRDAFGAGCSMGAGLFGGDEFRSFPLPEALRPDWLYEWRSREERDQTRRAWVAHLGKKE